jgi:hypothetical protein
MTPLSVSALPFAMPSPWGGKRVFAHYFPPCPLSIDNQPSLTDYYNRNYLNPAGEGGKFLKQGGFWRQRPLGVPVSIDANWKQINMQREVAMAIARGITGFCVDVLGLDLTALQMMLIAAAAVDGRFKIVPMLDMIALGSTLTPAQAASIIAAVNPSSAALRLDDGRLVFAAYNAPAQAPAWWAAMIGLLNAENIDIAFVPVLPGGATDAGALDPIAYGMGVWGTATPGPSSSLTAVPAKAAGLVYMLPVGPQQFRPKDSKFWEASNSQTFRNAWDAAITTGADWIQLVTWNDYSESSEVCPYTDATLDPRIGTGFYDLIAYYATWFATGKRPDITQDVLYWFHRREALTAAHPNQLNAFTPVLAGGGPEEDNIELLAFLTAPGVLQISITQAGVVVQTHSQAAPAGVTSFKVPLVAGLPTFALQRNGSNVFSYQGPVQIYGPEGLPSGVLDATYWNGSITKAGLTAYDLSTL